MVLLGFLAASPLGAIVMFFTVNFSAISRILQDFSICSVRVTDHNFMRLHDAVCIRPRFCESLHQSVVLSTLRFPYAATSPLFLPFSHFPAEAPDLAEYQSTVNISPTCLVAVNQKRRPPSHQRKKLQSFSATLSKRTSVYTLYRPCTVLLAMRHSSSLMVMMTLSFQWRLCAHIVYMSCYVLAAAPQNISNLKL